MRSSPYFARARHISDVALACGAIGLLAALGGAVPLGAQTTLVRGESVRAQLTSASDAKWRARVDALTDDSITLTLEGTDTRVRARHGALPIERALGRQRTRGAVIGALTGASAMALTFLAGTRDEELGLGALIVPIVALGGGVAGAGLGAMAAPVRWVAVDATAVACPSWRVVPGSLVTLHTPTGPRAGRIASHDDSEIAIQSSAPSAVTERISTATVTLEVTGGRARGPAAWIGAGAGLLLGAIGSATDPDVGAGEGVAITLGNVAIGAGVGALFGPRRQARVPVTCRER
jgi:hypothetical protein